MPHMPAVDRRQSLVEAAIAVMTREGVRAATTRKVVEEAGASLATFHYCFHTKDELIEAVIEQTNREFLSWHTSPSPDAKTAREAIDTSIRGLWSITRRFPRRQAMLFELTQYARRQESLQHLAAKQYNDYYGTWAKFFTELTERFDVQLAAPAEDIARFAVSLVDGLTFNYLIDMDAKAAEGVLDVAIAALAGQTLAGTTKATRQRTNST